VLLVFQERHHLGLNTVKVRLRHRALSYVSNRVLVKLNAAVAPHVKALYELVGRNYGWQLSSIGEL
jgi:hypothetical protein